MPFEIIRNDITDMRVDAIVNTANPRPVIGSGTDAAVHAKAGPMLLLARKWFGILNTGEVCITPGFQLPAKYVIHTVGPVWYDGGHGEALLLRQCYEHALELAWRHRVKSIAFPLISTGNYGFPKRLALEIAVETIRGFLKEHELQVYLVVFGRETLELSGGLVDRVRSFIDDACVREREKAEYSFSVSRDFDFIRERLEAPEEIFAEPETFPCPSSPVQLPVERQLTEDDLSRRKTGQKSYRNETAEKPRPLMSQETGLPRPRAAKPKKKPAISPFDAGELTRMVKEADEGFSETLMKLIVRSGEKDSDVYKRANVDRKLFSKIRNNPQYKPSKATALAFAVALKLDLEETRDFIGRAGYALSRSSTFDIIIEYFIIHERYDIYEINLMLFEFDQSMLGA